MKRFIKRLRCDWRWLIIPWVIDKQNQTETDQKMAKLYNLAFGVGIFGTCFFLFFLWKLPDIKGAITVDATWLFFYVAFCAIMNSLRVNKSSAGRKPKQNYVSLKDLFVNIEDYTVFDRYVCSHYSIDRQLKSKDALNLLLALVNKGVLKDNSLDPLAKQFLKEYHPKGIVSPSSSRAITKPIPDAEKIKQLQAELQRESSK